MIVTAYDIIRRDYNTTCTSCGETLRKVTDEDLVRAEHPEALMSTLTFAINHNCTAKEPIT